jgi:hypothetical protein
MKYKNIQIIMLLFVTCSFWACKKELNVYPTTSEVDGNVIVDAKSAATVLNGVYYRFANAGVDNNSVPTVEWSSVNESVPSELSGMLTNSSGDDGILSFTFNSKNSEISDEWTYGYNLVNAANGFLKNVDPITSIPAATKKQMEAEALFLRAFANEQLLLYFGQYNDPASKYGIILRDQFVNISNINQPRATVAATYASILADLNTAIAGLPSLNTQIYYGNSWTAKLLEAQVLINRGASGDYTQVISLTNDIINNGPFSLETNVKDVFWTKGFASKEVMLGVQPYATETYKYLNNQFYIQYPASDSLISFLKNDPRNKWVYQTAISPYYGPLPEFTKYYSGDPTNVNQTTLSEYCYAFRLTEAYLLQAEAITLSGGNMAQAKILLKTVEGHAGITDFTDVDNASTAAALQVLVVKEEMKNFVGENGQDWFALRRLPFATMQTLQPAIKTATTLIFPIPNTEITTNSQAIQNPGYSN